MDLNTVEIIGLAFLSGLAATGNFMDDENEDFDKPEIKIEEVNFDNEKDFMKFIKNKLKGEN